MKKYSLYLWLFALVAMITSCSQDETDALTANESNRVSFTASLPADFAQAKTRAKLPTQTDHALRCIIEVWTQGDTPELKYREEKTNLSGENLTFDFTIDDGTYDCLFWADFIAKNPSSKDETIGDVTFTHYPDKYYTTNDATNGLKAVSIVESEYAFNTDARDAFFSHETLEKKAGSNTTLPTALKRPFAKLNLKEKDPTTFALCKEMTASYTVQKTFNVLAGTATDDYTASYNAAPAGNGTTNLTLFSDYVFTSSDTRETMQDITLTFTKQDDADKDLQSVTIPAGVPVQRNYKTNAVGYLIYVTPDPTNKATVTVTMDNQWGDPEIYDDPDVALAKTTLGKEVDGANESDGKKHVFQISNEAQLRALHVLVANNITLDGNVSTNGRYTYAIYKLTADINLNDAPWTPIGFASSGSYPFMGTFDGQGHTISGLNASGKWEFNGFVASLYGTVKHLIVKGKVAADGSKSGNGFAGGIAAISRGTIAFCSFEGTVSISNAATKANIGGICGDNGWVNDRGTITSCFAHTTLTISNTPTTEKKGGIAGNNITDLMTIGTVQGCTWYYKSGATPEGIEACYDGWTSPDADKKNASYSNASGLSGRLTDMNGYNSTTGYDYKWEVEGSTLKLTTK